MPEPSGRSSRRPVAMLAHSYYEEDPRVRREAESVAASGRQVDVFALRRPADEPEATIDDVRVRRLDVQRHQGAGLATYLREYVAFFGRAAWALARAHRRRHYALVQVHTLPDALVFAALPLKLAGVPLLLDLHEAMPEFFQTRFPSASNPVALAALRLQERWSIGLADAAITVNDALVERLVRLGVPAAKVSAIPNSPSLARFDPTIEAGRSFMVDDVLRLVYAGALSPVYELDVAIDALARLAALRPGLAVTLDLYGRDFEEVGLREQVARLGLGDCVRFRGRIPIEAVPAALAAADVGLAPTRRSGFTDFSLSTKIFEYAAMGKPVVASRLPMVQRTFGTGEIATYEPGSADDLARVILELVDDPERRATQTERASRRVETVAWEHESSRYLDLIERLAIDGLSSAEPAPPDGHRSEGS